MATTLISLYGPARLAATASILYTAPANAIVGITAASAVNTDSSTRLFSVYIVRSGGSVTDAELVYDEKALSPQESLPLVELISHVLNAGDTIRAFADSANLVNVVISGVKFQ